MIQSNVKDTDLKLKGLVKKLPVLGKAIRLGANRIGDAGRTTVHLSNLFQRPGDATLKPGSLLSRARQLGSNAALLSPYGARYWLYNKLTPGASTQTSRLIGKELIAPMIASTAGNPEFQQHLKNVEEQLPNTTEDWRRLATRWKGHPFASAAMHTGTNWAVNTGNPFLPSIPSRASVQMQPVMKEVFKDPNTRAIIPRALDSKLNMPSGTAEQIALDVSKLPQYARLREWFAKR